MTERAQAQDGLVSLLDSKPQDFQPVFLLRQGALTETIRDEEESAQLSMWGPRQLELLFDDR